jgi:Protein of unknown function (DUF1631)
MTDIDVELQQRHRALYARILEEAANGGGTLVVKLIAAARLALQARLSASQDFRERDVLTESLQQLRLKEPEIRRRYPEALLEAFHNPETGRKEAQVLSGDLQFDQLELMDEVQVHESVVLARAQQSVLLAAEASLTELNTLIATAQGLLAVRPDRNPLRPAVFVNTLKTVVDQTGISPHTRLGWMAPMSSAMGKELRELYDFLVSHLNQAGVEPAGYVVTPTASAVVPGVGVSSATQAALAVGSAAQSTAVQQAPDAMDALLTLDKLRRLLSGELEPVQPATRVQAFAEQFAKDFEQAAFPALPPIADFEATVPAAFEALSEMKQTDHVIRRLEQRMVSSSGVTGAVGDALAATRQALRQRAKGVAQALSLEVMALMVDNMARDSRLLPPVQALLRSLEPALLRLALVDPRFFTDKQHPARVVLQELTHRSLAYPSADASGFADFMNDVGAVVEPLSSLEVTSAEPFEHALFMLRDSWNQTARERELAREKAVAMLQRAEQRNLVAEKVAREITQHPDAAQVPVAVIDFLCGPWAQVVAHARLSGAQAASAAEKYHALISALLWSTHPGLARKNIAKLTRVVPRLISTLREGLESIQYPVIKTSAFLEVLMGLHQAIFQSVRESVLAQDHEAKADSASAPKVPEVSLRDVESAEPWVAPEEAQASNFMELPELADALTPATAPTMQSGDSRAEQEALDVPATDHLQVGSWVDLRVEDKWVRTQLTWASPHRSLFLFTSAYGTTQSMTRRSMEKLLAVGNLKVVSMQAVVDGALDAVAKQAMRNSIDTIL